MLNWFHMCHMSLDTATHYTYLFVTRLRISGGRHYIVHGLLHCKTYLDSQVVIIKSCKTYLTTFFRVCTTILFSYTVTMCSSFPGALCELEIPRTQQYLFSHRPRVDDNMMYQPRSQSDSKGVTH